MQPYVAAQSRYHTMAWDNSGELFSVPDLKRKNKKIKGDPQQPAAMQPIEAGALLEIWAEEGEEGSAWHSPGMGGGRRSPTLTKSRGPFCVGAESAPNGAGLSGKPQPKFPTALFYDVNP